MSRNRLALVSDDPRMAGDIQAHLRKVLGQSAFQSSFDDTLNHLEHDFDGLLLLAVTGPDGIKRVSRLVQGFCINKLPLAIVIIENEGRADANPGLLDPYVACRLRWPTEAAALTNLARARRGRARGLVGHLDEPAQGVIERRLSRLTPSLAPFAEGMALAAAHDVAVLLTGETGTGKTYLARLLHECSPRKSLPFVTVPCGAQPANLFESAFFGHVKGAFTGADRAKTGKFEAAGQGTILLDEIDTLGLEQQAALLRVIETGEYEPVGSNETKICKARIIVASNWDLQEAVDAGRFRRDLYYRINVLSFHLPPLRQRVQDIAPLVRGMVDRYNTKFQKDLFDITPHALAALASYPWPGNIRQLENSVQQAVLVSSGPHLLLEHLPHQVREYLPPFRAAAAPERHGSLSHNREQIERDVIQRVLSNNGYSRTQAASALGISRVTLYKKIKKYDLRWPALQGSRN
jgi:DNA-binding NtrC family response regulator